MFALTKSLHPRGRWHGNAVTEGDCVTLAYLASNFVAMLSPPATSDYVLQKENFINQAITPISK